MKKAVLEDVTYYDASNVTHARIEFAGVDEFGCGDTIYFSKKRARTVRAKRPAQQLRAAIAKFTFYIEHRSKVWVLQEKSGGCRPATPYEVVMWKFLQRAAA